MSSGLIFGMVNLLLIIIIIGVILYTFYSINSVKSDVTSLINQTNLQLGDIDLNASEIKVELDSTKKATDELTVNKTNYDDKINKLGQELKTDLSDTNTHLSTIDTTVSKIPIVGSSNAINFKNDGTGISWGSNYSKIYDDGTLHIDTDDKMNISAPVSLNISAPNTTISGNTKFNGPLAFDNNGTGLVWGNNYSKIYDDGILHINTDDSLYLSAPSNLNITTPNTTISGNITANKMCIGTTCVTEDHFKTLISQSVLYTFTTFKFTNAGVTGKTGPTLNQCVSAYSSASWASNTTYFNMTTQGIQLWTVPATGSYTITVAGAIGGTGATGIVGGNGAIIVGTFTLTNNDTIKILVGQSGSSGNCGGGGGGSFVANSYDIPLIIAGGGGGGEYTNPANASKQASATTTANNGIDGKSSTINGYGGNNGNGGGAGLVYKGCGAGGGGLKGDGTQSSASTTLKGGYPGIAFINGGQGGAKTGTGGDGGFGGGGGGEWQYFTGGGGGGGYSGGGGGSYYGCGGGGGSYNSGTSQTNTGGANNGMGYVTITKN
jgi:hypothetical protein